VQPRPNSLETARRSGELWRTLLHGVSSAVNIQLRTAFDLPQNTTNGLCRHASPNGPAENREQKRELADTRNTHRCVRLSMRFKRALSAGNRLDAMFISALRQHPCIRDVRFPECTQSRHTTTFTGVPLTKLAMLFIN